MKIQCGTRLIDVTLQFRCTEDAIAFGRSITGNEDEIKRCQKFRDHYITIASTLSELGDLEDALKMATKGQFWSEAYQAATKTGICAGGVL